MHEAIPELIRYLPNYFDVDEKNYKISQKSLYF